MLCAAEFSSLLPCTFFTGVPDSLLAPFCSHLLDVHGTGKNHVVAANEGAAAALAAGYHLATGKIPCVYLQNSGLGHIANPAASLLHPLVYAIPCVFVVGWRGEPGLHDEPQHVFQGQITLRQLELLGIAHTVVEKETTAEQLKQKNAEFAALLGAGKSVAYVIKKGALTGSAQTAQPPPQNVPLREEIIRTITEFSGGDVIVSTTGKTSRELFELRRASNAGHERDFLTVGSMGHSLSIALGIALQKPNRRIWCIDGDGAVLMHMGCLASVGAQAPTNLVHVVINNSAHESVGGQPTASAGIDFASVARACGYAGAFSAQGLAQLKDVLSRLGQTTGPVFIEVKSAVGSRPNLGRPTTTPAQNKAALMQNLLCEE